MVTDDSLEGYGALVPSFFIRIFKRSKQQMEVRTALSALPYFVYKEVNYCYTAELSSLLRSMNPSYRRRAVICCYKIFVTANSYHEIADFETITNSIVERLEDVDQGVQISTIACIQENAKKRPEYWIRIIPSLFKLLATVQQNWKLIKIILTLNFFTQYEPRLKAKLKSRVEELLTIVTAKSVEFELLKLYVKKLASKQDISQSIIERVLSFIDPADANIQYLGLQLVLELRKKDVILPKLETQIEKWIEINDPTLLKLVQQIISLSVNLENLRFFVDALLINLPQGSSLSVTYKQKREFLIDLVISLFEGHYSQGVFQFWFKVFMRLVNDHSSLRSKLGMHLLRMSGKMSQLQNDQVIHWVFKIFESEEDSRVKVKENSQFAKYTLMSWSQAKIEQKKEKTEEVLKKIEELQYFQEYEDYCEGLLYLFLQLDAQLPYEEVEQRIVESLRRFPLNRALRLQAGLIKMKKGGCPSLKNEEFEESEIQAQLSQKVQVPIEELNLLKKAEKE